MRKAVGVWVDVWVVNGGVINGGGSIGGNTTGYCSRFVVLVEDIGDMNGMGVGTVELVVVEGVNCGGGGGAGGGKPLFCNTSLALSMRL